MIKRKQLFLTTAILPVLAVMQMIQDTTPVSAFRPAPPGISQPAGAPAPADRRRIDLRRSAAGQLTASRGWLGVSIQDLTEVIRKNMNLPSAEGVLVTEVMADGPAAKAGLKAGDVILEFNRSKIGKATDLTQLVAGSAPGASTVLLIRRDGKTFFVAATMGKADPAASVAVAQPEPKQPVPAVKTEPQEKLPPVRPETYAVVIGIDYRGRADIPNLKFASEDAKKIHAVLIDPRYGGVPKENARLLLNEKATRNEMLAALRKIRTWDGYVYVYFSGHGAPMTKDDKLVDAFLVPYDVAISDPEILSETSIRLSYLQDLVESSHARGVMVALDACFSGGGKSIVAKGAKPLVGVLSATPLLAPKGAGKLFLTSSAMNQQSWEDDTELRGGIFSHYLLEGLKGKAADDVWVKGDDLARYVKGHVARAVMKLKGVEQDPQTTGRGDFAVARNWEKAKVLDADKKNLLLKKFCLSA